MNKKNKWRVEGLYFLPTEVVTFTVGVRARSISKAINCVRRHVKRIEFPKRVDYFTVTKISKD